MCSNALRRGEADRRPALRLTTHRSIILRMITKAGEPNEQTARALVAQALRLSESERVRVAAELLESVEGPPDEVSDDEWLAEINRRADSVRRGESVGEPWSVVRDELLAELKK
jgi:putative addiction module component (TIGR02574 family)